MDLNTTYQKTFNTAKSIIKEHAYIIYYDETTPPYIETEAS